MPSGIVTTEAELGLKLAELTDLVLCRAGVDTSAGVLAAVDATCKSFVTVLTPSTTEASFPAAVRSKSLATFPESVTMPLLAPTVIPFVVMFESALILL